MEIFDLYTRDREKTDYTVRRGEPIPDGYYHIAVHVCIFNSKDEMLIQQRQPFKEGWPNMWDITVGGSVVRGETSKAAAEREVLEEIGYKLNLDDTRPILTVHFEKGFDDIYTVHKDLDIGKLKLQYEEVQAVKWASEVEINEMIDKGIFIPFHKSLINLLFFMRNHRGSHMREE